MSPAPSGSRPRRAVAAAPPAAAEAPEGASREARRLAAAILEVLAGAQAPGEAARALGISLARYYQLEGRALAGLVAACEARRRGRQAGTDVAALRRECERLRRECFRQQALARAARRAAGLAPPAPEPPAPGTERRRRGRRPTARALRAAARLQQQAGEVPAAPAAREGQPEEAPPGS